MFYLCFTFVLQFVCLLHLFCLHGLIAGVGDEISAHIFVGQDSKINDVYKSKDNSRAEFLGAFQDQVRERGVPTTLIADNAPMYIGLNVAKYLRDLVVSMWQCETKY